MQGSPFIPRPSRAETGVFLVPAAPALSGQLTGSTIEILVTDLTLVTITLAGGPPAGDSLTEQVIPQGNANLYGTQWYVWIPSSRPKPYLVKSIISNTQIRLEEPATAVAAGTAWFLFSPLAGYPQLREWAVTNTGGGTGVFMDAPAPAAFGASSKTYTHSAMVWGDATGTQFIIQEIL